MHDTGTDRKAGWTAAAICFCLAAGVFGGAQGFAQESPTGYAAEINDPFFGIFIEMSERDLLVRWGTDELHDYVETFGRPSRLPFEAIASIERRVLPEAEVVGRRGVSCRRELIVSLAEGMKTPMPYSILGYHPGSLQVADTLVLREWHLGDASFVVDDEEHDHANSTVDTRGITIFTLADGWIVLDVDGWLDRLLGGKLDDSWTMGFVFCRTDEGITGLAMGMNRKDRRVYGEFDFLTDKVMPHGRSLATALANWVWPWLQPVDSTSLWNYEEAE